MCCRNSPVSGLAGSLDIFDLYPYTYTEIVNLGRV
jgi:hypothetical protein